MKVLFLDMAGTFVLVDDEDYDWARQWLWRKKFSRKKKNGTARKLYAYRIGWRGTWRGSIYLHVEICERAPRAADLAPAAHRRAQERPVARLPAREPAGLGERAGEPAHRAGASSMTPRNERVCRKAPSKALTMP